MSVKMEVLLNVFGRNHKTKLKKEDIIHGRMFYCKLDSNNNLEYKHAHFAGSIPYTVERIVVNSEITLILSSYTEYDNTVQDKIAQELDGFISKDEIYKAFDRANKLIPLELYYKTSEYNQSKISTIKSIVNRLNLFNHLLKVKEDIDQRLTLQNIQKIGTKNHLDLNYLQSEYYGLLNYLMLTCFDTLGQNDGWMDFGSWLNSSKKKEEREGALLKLSNEDGILKQSKELYEYYLKLYGTRNSFYNFIDTLIPDEYKGLLLNSIKIEKIKFNLLPGLEIVPVSDDEKKKALFEIRNKFTHSAKAKEKTQPGSTSDKEGRYWITREESFDGKTRKIISVCDWPLVLNAVVKAGFAEFLKKV